MKYRIPLRAALPLLALAALAALPSCQHDRRPIASGDTTAQSGTIVLHDVEGNRLQIRPPLKRVISLAPNITEIVFAVGGGDALVGRTSWCNYPPAAERAPVVGDMLTLNYERIIALHPELLLMTHVGDISANHAKLRELGLETYVLHDSTIPQVISAIDTVGLMLGHTAEAGVVSGRLRRVVDSITALGHSGPPVRFFIVIDRAPLMTASRGFLADALEMAGGTNIASGGVTAYPKYSREELLRNDPPVIIVPATSWSDVEELINLYPEWRKLRAVREGHVYAIPTDLISRPGPRIGTGLILLYRALHGADARKLFEDGVKG